MTGPETLRLLNTERRIHNRHDWDREDWPKLWRYNAHYFDDLTAAKTATRLDWQRDFIRRWIAENPPGHGSGWEPYPSSLRIVNWIKWALAGNHLDQTTRDSLAVQTRWLRGRLEIHLLGNHLWANAKALIFAGAYFEGEEAARWRDKGLALLRRELTEQILPDGGHFERSPMYHAIALEDLLDLVQLAHRYPSLLAGRDVARWGSVARRMMRWLRVMTHPDGEIAFFNDAAFGIAPNHAAQTAYAALLGVAADSTPLAAIEPLPESGYVRLAAGAAVLIADVGSVGPSYLPGHAHAGTLSFELSLHNRRVLVNGGTSTYAAGSERLRQRGTAAHNTLLIDQLDSSEVWSSFRVARRARVRHRGWGKHAATLRLEATHDGYLRLPGKVAHRREWQLDAQSLRVCDSIKGQFSTAEARFHFAPGYKVDPLRQEAKRPASMAVLRWTSEGGNATLVNSTWHPRFGMDEPCDVLSLRLDRPTANTHFFWS